MADVAVGPKPALAGLTLPSYAPAFGCADAGPAARFVFRGSSSALGDAFGVALPQTAGAAQLMQACAANGMQDLDHSALVRALELMANHTVAPDVA